MRVVLITGSEIRHRYIAAELAAFGIDLMCFCERTPVQRQKVIMGAHYETRLSYEKESLYSEELDDQKIAIKGKIRFIEKGAFNSDKQLQAEVKNFSPKFIFFYGCSIIPNNVIEAFSAPLINVHLGLSPYYRGSGTNFWPIYNGEPEFCGVTYHRLVAKVDAGEICFQRRSDPLQDGNVHSHGFNLIKGIPNDLVKIFDLKYENIFSPGKISFPVSPRLLYKQSDFNEEVSEYVDLNFNDLMEDYTINKIERDLQAPILNFETRYLNQ